MLILLLQPIKAHAWDNIRALGDNALSQRQFSQARLEYQKLRLLNFRSQEPFALYHRLNLAEKDLMTLKSFYQERNEIKQLNLLNQASADYSSPEEALTNCQQLDQTGDKELTIYCIAKTNTTWPTYRDGWLTTIIFAQKYGDAELAKTATEHALELDPYFSEK